MLDEEREGSQKKKRIVIGRNRGTDSRKKRWEDYDGGGGQKVGEGEGQTVVSLSFSQMSLLFPCPSS